MAKKETKAWMADQSFDWRSKKVLTEKVTLRRKQAKVRKQAE
jgi:hypothetical protein